MRRPLPLPRPRLDPSRTLLLAAALAGFIPPRSVTAAAPPTQQALVDATIITAPGDTLRHGTILIADGLVQAVGPQLTPPPGARIWDLHDRWIHAGFIDLYVEQGIEGETQPAKSAKANVVTKAATNAATRGARHPHPEMRADYAAAEHFALAKELRDSFRAVGFTAIAPAPTHGVFRGTSALLSLAPLAPPGECVLRRDLHSIIAFQTGQPDDDTYPTSLMGVIAFIRQTCLDAHFHQTALRDWQQHPQHPRPAIDLGLDALTQILPPEPTLPVLFKLEQPRNAARAAHIATEMGLNVRFLGSGLEFEELDAVIAAAAPLILPLHFPARPLVEKMSSDEELALSLQTLRRWHDAPANPARLAAAGLSIALTTHGLKEPKEFPEALRKALEAGLDPETALAALTTVPAALAGLPQRLGRIAPGQFAHLVIADGPPFAAGTRITATWIDGHFERVIAGTAETAEAPGQAAAATPPTAPAEAAPTPPGVPNANAAAAPAEIPRARKPGPLLTPAATLIRNATIWTEGPPGTLRNTDLLIRDRRIAAIGRDLDAPTGAHIVDAAGAHLTPGLIDAHSHIAIDGEVNEGTQACTAEARIEDVLNPRDPNIFRQLAGGLTCSHTMHGSANPMGAQNLILKLRWGADAANLRFAAAPPTIKFALGENVKQSNWGEKYTTRFPQTRNGVEAFMRERFSAARDYAAARRRAANHRGAAPIRRDLELETLNQVLTGERIVHCHSYRQDEILMFLRLAEEFGFPPGVMQHVLEGYKVADELAAVGAGASTFSDWWAYKYEVKDAIPWNAALMAERGVLVSFNSDDAEMGRRLNLEAAKAVKYGGLDEAAALAMVTINSARQLRIDHRVGSLEVGKDADLTLFSGPPLSSRARVLQTWIDGKLYFDAELVGEVQAEIEAERRALIAACRTAAEKPPKSPTETAMAPSIASAPPKSAISNAAAAPDTPTPDSTASDSTTTIRQVRQVRQVRPLPPLPDLPPTPPPTSTVLLGATIHTLHGRPMRGATLLLTGSRIAALGHDLPIPPDATRIEVDGLHIYPGLIDANTTLGLVEIGAVRATRDVTEVGRIKPQIRAEVSLNPDSDLIPVARLNGITHALTHPGGGLLIGTSALIRLDGWTWEDLTLQAPAALHVGFPAPHLDFAADAKPPLAEQRRKFKTSLHELSDAFAAARAYRRARRAALDGDGPTVETDRRWEALLPAIDGDLPVLIHANSVPQIKAAVAWAVDEEIAPVLVGAREAWRCADWLAARRVPLLLDAPFRLPTYDWDAHDSVFRGAAILADAGIRFAITYGWDANIRNLPYAAAAYSAYGLSPRRALQAITSTPAEILGLGARVGSLAANMDASFIVTDGDPLDIRTTIHRVFISGREIPMESKQTRLRDRYAARPRCR
jgi:imidazolonepropionase-like amidohydrolase